MEVVIDRDAFLKGLQMVQNIVEPRQTLPILANVLLEAAGDTVRLTATDLEVGARVSVPAKVGAKGTITVSARKLAEIVKELPAAAVVCCTRWTRSRRSWRLHRQSWRPCGQRADPGRTTCRSSAPSAALWRCTKGYAGVRVIWFLLDAR